MGGPGPNRWYGDDLVEQCDRRASGSLETLRSRRLQSVVVAAVSHRGTARGQFSPLAATESAGLAAAGLDPHHVLWTSEQIIAQEARAAEHASIFARELPIDSPRSRMD
jgi:hypothetical protein